jgi:hypothetical protein
MTTQQLPSTSFFCGGISMFYIYILLFMKVDGLITVIYFLLLPVRIVDQHAMH